ncbi:MAG TPA: thiamine phosphate synthase [Gammaproteobacteria bacterium]|nr:thiamine phosphate synthase [Gammaproteobacteria bacterium]
MKTDSRLHGLYAITHQGYSGIEQLLQETEAALKGGARIVQYRDKSADPHQRQEQASELAGLCRHHQASLIINDDVELAITVGAQGVHLGKDDDDIVKARALLGPEAIIGISCYNQLALAEHAAAAGASYVAFGSFYPSPTKPDAVRASTELLTRWSEFSLPSCAIGGITLDNAAPLISAGASMLAVISDLWSAPDIEQHARRFAALWD